jgi:uncharacterized membrane-anchored protein YjiN (DUF445 family)
MSRKSEKTKESKKPVVIHLSGQVQEMNQPRSPYCHALADTIEGWDTKTLVSKLEEQVGNDLQYIRINGTIVGGLVGLLLYAVERLL